MGDTLFSDDFVTARDALASSHLHVLRSLCIEEVDNAIVLSGHVESFYQKQLAQEVVRAACKVTELVNQVVVD